VTAFSKNKLQTKDPNVKVKIHVSRTSCQNFSSIQRLMKQNPNFFRWFKGRKPNLPGEKITRSARKPRYPLYHKSIFALA